MIARNSHLSRHRFSKQGDLSTADEKDLLQSADLL